MMNVLIVDDDRLTRMGLINVMPWKQFGFQVVGEAANGLEALELMKTRHIDLVLSDIEMPGMQGLEFIERASGLYPATYFVVLTIHTDFNKIQQALRLGAIDYIAKTDFDRENDSVILKRILDRINREKEKKNNGSPASTGMLRTAGGDLIGSWHELNWITDRKVYNGMLSELNNYALPASFLKKLTQSITDAWNETYSLIAREELPAPDLMQQAFSFAEWTSGIIGQTHRLMIRYPYSEDIFNSIVQVGCSIRKKIATQIHIKDIAQSAHLSRSYFCQCFKDIYHMSFLDYLRKLRMEAAVRYLLETNETIHRIANEIGYDDEKYFSRIFKSVYGVSPLDYRRDNREKQMETATGIQ